MKKLLFLLIIGVFLVTACSSGSPPPGDNKNNPGEENQVKALGKIDAARVMNDYKETFWEVADSASEKGRVKDLNSKDELIDYFTEIMSRDLANWYADTYFYEENGALFIKAMDAPTWLADKPFDLEKVTDAEYKIIQERNNEVLGHVNMIFVLSHNGENWIVKEIQREEVGGGNSDTGVTPQKAEQIVRAKLQLEDDEDVHVVYDHEENGKYVIHVFDVVGEGKSSHTATRGWYYVDQKTGEVTDMMN